MRMKPFAASLLLALSGALGVAEAEEPQTTALFLGVATSQASTASAFERASHTDGLLGLFKLKPENALATNCVWGLDVAVNEDNKGEPTDSFIVKDASGKTIAVHSAEPLLGATQRLFGIKTQPRFPLPQKEFSEIPGRQHDVKGPCQIWAAVAVLQGEDRKNVIVANCGSCPKFKSDKTQIKYFETIMQELCAKALQEAKDKNIVCKNLFASFRETWVPEGNFGCAIAATPQMQLPKEALPAEGLEKLYGMKIKDWEANLNLQPLPSFEE